MESLINKANIFLCLGGIATMKLGKMSGSQKVEVNVELSKDVYDLLFNYCNWRDLEIDSLIERLVFESIHSDIGFKQDLRSQEKLKMLEEYFG